MALVWCSRKFVVGALVRVALGERDGKRRAVLRHGVCGCRRKRKWRILHNSDGVYALVAIVGRLRREKPGAVCVSDLSQEGGRARGSDATRC